MFQIFKSDSILPTLLLVAIWLISLFYIQQWGLAPFPWEIKNYLLGQKLNQGFLIYEDISDNTAPLAALFYQIVQWFSIPVHWNIYISSIIVIYQSYIFQQTIQRFELMPQIGYLPFLMYAIIFHLSLEFLAPGPALVGLTFLLLAWREIIYQQRTLQVNDRVILIGIYMAIASLFYLSYSLFFVWALLSLLFYSGITLRQIVLMFVGFLMVFSLNILFFSINGNLPFMIQVFKRSAFQFQVPEQLEVTQIAGVFAPALFIGIWGFWLVLRSRRIRSNAQKGQQTNLIWLITAIFATLTVPSLIRINLLFFLPALAYFGLNIFHLSSNSILKEVALWLLIGGTWYNVQVELKNKDRERIPAPTLTLKNQRLMVLGPQIEEYLGNQMVGPFVNWDLAKPLFSNLDQYKNVVLLHEYFEKDAPDYIYDAENNIKKLSVYLPNLKREYRQISPNLYQKNP
ncbi:hypothetical protein [Aquirufa nivalisilvae]|uniref:hypothetical protein n=1 Tax=Aquirufa nivalisilvae TaxID=2516557 RepID=UPI0022A9B23C|nr:hypothetical protein [Aquirufa nivalisilvae]MCZ2480803.1 hypothetical protein [Aquirufa nivalisilvae]